MNLYNKAALSIIIVNYRSEHYLDKCIASIYSESRCQQFEIIVVNNDQETDLRQIAKKYPGIEICNHGKNIGFGAACNYGAKRASGKILLFLNPDTRFLNDYVGVVLNKIAVNEKNLGIIGPRLITDEGEVQEWCTGKDLTVRQLIKNNFWITESKKIWESKAEIFVDWVSGAALAIKKEIFEEIKGFDEKFFMYGEDLDLCKRTRDLGYKILYYSTASILHSGGKSRENPIRQKIQFYKSSLYYMIKKGIAGLKSQK